ncbi:MAG TPA: zf-HC2 domain-containing protein [Ktedonobacterales bacterium]|nr:zf-HC2 domain-containing protein [Ktedonobacterales bacterium]
MEPSNALSCQELVELVTAYLDGALTPADHARFDEHLAVCDGCSHYVDQMRRTIALTGRLAESSVTGVARDRLLETFRSWKAP